jgi:sugar lactone lactonase YvrE
VQQNPSKNGIGACLTRAVCISLTCFGASTFAADNFPPAPVTAPGVTVSIYASGLQDPRGLAWGPGGELFVAEAGTTIGRFVPPPPPAPSEPPTRTRCEVYWPVGPKTGGATGRISRIDPDGSAHIVAAALPSTAANRLIGGDRMGAAAVALRGQRLFVMVNGGGCSQGNPSDPNGVYQVFADGSFVPRVDLGSVLRSTTDSKSPLDGDFEPDGVWFNMLRAFGAFYSTEPNHGLLVRIDDDWNVTLVTDLIGKVREADGDGDYTYSALVRHRDHFYVGTLGRIDQDFAGSIYRVARDGSSVTRVATGLRGVLGVAFDRTGTMYALETTAAGVAPPLSDPTAGRLVRIEADGSITPIVSQLAFPTALAAGRDGAFYVSNCGYHCDDLASGASLGVGQVLRIEIAGVSAEASSD